MRIVVDTNVVVSFVLNQASLPGRVIGLVESQRAELILTQEIVDEFREVLLRPNIAARHRLSATEIDSLVHRLEAVGTRCTPAATAVSIPDDPDDEVFLKAAIGGDANFIVSGDRHLLELGTVQNIRIVSPRSFLEMLGELAE